MKITKDSLSEAISKIASENELEVYDFLEQATCIIIDEPIREVVVDAIRVRKKWHQIKMEYRAMKEEVGGAEAIRHLSEKYHYSERNIERILYETGR